MTLTERHDLRSGDPPWDDGRPAPSSDPLPGGRVDVAIVGAGITGVSIAERLAVRGMSVAVLDRRPPACGSTAASTALVMWEMDVPLTHLARRIGADAAAQRWRRVHAAVERLGHRLEDERLDGAAEARPTLYLEGALLPGAALAAEGEARRIAGLPSDWLAAGAVAERFAIAPRAALVSAGGFAVDPVALTLALLERARAAGATVSYPVDVTALSTDEDALVLETDAGPVVADRGVLASGYERAPLFLPPAFGLRTSYAIATPPGTAPLWREEVMIWEAAGTYLYARATADGRIVAGGEDDAFGQAEARDRHIGVKAGAIAGKLGALLGGRAIAPEQRWAATFGSSPDGLPAIGRARNHQRLWLASGFGGNGVSFAALAAELIDADFAGTPDPIATAFDPYRFGD